MNSVNAINAVNSLLIKLAKKNDDAHVGGGVVTVTSGKKARA